MKIRDFFDQFIRFKILAEYLKTLIQRLQDHHFFLSGGGLAFSLFICILPLILILFSFLGVIVQFSEVKHQLNIFIDTLIPYQNTSNMIKDIINQRIEEFQIHKTVSGIAGFIGLLFASSGLFSSMRTILNTIFLEFEEKNVMIGKLRDIGMTFIVLAFFLASMAIFPALDIGLNYITKLELFSTFKFEQISLSTISYLFSAFSFLIIFKMFFLIYYLIPYAKLDLRVICLSAFIGSTLWIIAKEIFGYYIANVATISKIYGTYLFIVIVGFWIYYSSLILILSAEIGQLYREKMFNVKKIS